MSRQVRCSMSLVLVLVLVGTCSVQADSRLVGWWKLDEGAGGTAADASGYGNHGTLVGGCQWVSGHYGGGHAL